MNTSQTQNQIVFIDSAVADPATLMAGLAPGTEVVMLQPGSDGLSQIAAALAGRSNLQAIHLISHGSSGQILLGSTTLNATTLTRHLGALDVITNAMIEDGEWLIYGCDVAAGFEGRRFVDELRQITGLKVAAASHKVGAQELGGSWVLDDAPVLAIKPLQVEAWAHVLTTYIVTTTTDDMGAGSLRAVLAAAHIGDTITFDAGLNANTITLGSNLTVTSGVTLDFSALTTLSITGNALAFDANSATLNIGAGDTITIASGITSTAAGSLVQTGMGTLKLSSTSNPTNFLGSLKVMGGSTLSDGLDSIQQLPKLITLDGGTLTHSYNWGFDGTVTIGAQGGTISVAAGIGFYPKLSGSGTVTQAGPGGMSPDITNFTGNVIVEVSQFYPKENGSGLGQSITHGSIEVKSGAWIFLGANQNVTIGNGESLTGGGTINGNVIVKSGGTIDPGTSTTAGKLTITGNLTVEAGGIASTQIGGTIAGTGYDQIAVAGTVDVTDATLSSTLINAFAPATGNSFVLISNGASDVVTGTFTSAAQGSMVAVSGTPLKISYTGDTGNDLVLTQLDSPPAFVSATVNASTLVLTYNEALNATALQVPVAGDFAVLVGGNANSVTAVVVDAALKTVTLTLTAPVTQGQTVTVGYTAPTPNSAPTNAAIQDAIGNDAITLAATAVNVAPAINDVPGTAQAVTVGVVAELANFTVADVDSNSLSVTLTATKGTINGLTDVDSTTGGIQLTGTAATINSAIAAATFTATAAGAASIGISVRDGVLATPSSASYSLTATAAPTPAADPTPTPTPVVDNDGVPDAQENAAPGLTPAGGGAAVAGDGNGDGVADSQQSTVTSVAFLNTPTAQSNPASAPPVYVTLVAGSIGGKIDSTNTHSAMLNNVHQLDAPANRPAEIKMPLGLIAFTANVQTAGIAETFSLYVAPTLGVNGYWKTNAAGTWVNLASAAYGGKIVTEGGKIRMDFKITDGSEFDGDGKADGVITDPGAAGFMPLSIVGYVPELAAGTHFWF